MSSHHQVPDLVPQAAELRANGMPWPQVAAKLGRTPDVLKEICGKDPEAWNRHYQTFLTRALEDGFAETLDMVKSLQKTLEGKDRMRACALFLRMYTIQQKKMAAAPSNRSVPRAADGRAAATMAKPALTPPTPPKPPTPVTPATSAFPAPTAAAAGAPPPKA